VRSTLFYIPADFHGSVFGFGWLLAAWLMCGVVLALWSLRRPGGRQEIANLLPFFLLVAGVIAFLLPRIVEPIAGTSSRGLPIRGYGVMLTLATVVAVMLASYRARQVGIDPEKIFSLAFVMVAAGIVGARLFYVIQYWNEQFAHYTPGGGLDLAATAAAVVNVTQGGLVVYGSVLAGLPAGIWFCWKNRLPVLGIGDIIAPSMVVGLALGRVGCFLNGCCFGGVCLNEPYALTFPAGSPPYVQHEESGWDSGVWLTKHGQHVNIGFVAPHGPAAAGGLQAGDEIISINGAQVSELSEARRRLAAAQGTYELETADGRIVRWQAAKGPPRSVPIHATQLYAAIDAGLLALVLWCFHPYRRRDGEVFALLLTVHPLSRFFLEMIRSDEPGQFDTGLTISQWLSLLLLVAGVVLWIYVERQPQSRLAVE
jgi:phosphatidylglycerol:prolipoprotein diacylglycerol transferase